MNCWAKSIEYWETEPIQGETGINFAKQAGQGDSGKIHLFGKSLEVHFCAWIVEQKVSNIEKLIQSKEKLEETLQSRLGGVVVLISCVWESWSRNLPW